MDLSERERDLLNALKGTAKSALSNIPVLAQAVAAWDTYNHAKFERNVKSVLTFLLHRGKQDAY